MPSTNIISVTTGRHTFARSSGHCTAYVLTEDGKQVPISQGCIKMAGASVEIKMHRNFLSTCTYHTTSYDVGNGTVLALVSTTSRRGRVKDAAAVFIALRDTGPLMSIDFYPIPDRDSTEKKICIFEGKGDILGADELTDYNIKLRKVLARQGRNEESFNRLLKVKMIRPELAPRPKRIKIKCQSGEEKYVGLSASPQRKLKLKR